MTWLTTACLMTLINPGYPEPRSDLTPTLNHIFVIPDQTTYDAIAESDFVRGDFAVFEKRTTRRADMSYTGIYYYGRHTYFEFLPPTGAGFVEGSSGIAFGLETPGATDRLAEKLSEAGIEPFQGEITRELDGEQIPWFKILGIPAAGDSNLMLFTMEYQPEFLERWHSDLEPREGGVSRAAILDRYANHIAEVGERPKTLFDDIVKMHLELDAAEIERIEKLFEVFEYQWDRGAEQIVASGPGIQFVIVPVESSRGIVGFEVQLTESRNYFAPFRFGSSQLEIDGEFGRWTFEK